MLNPFDFPLILTPGSTDKKIRLEKDDIAPSYYEKVVSIVNKYFVPFFKQKDVREIRTYDIEDFFLQLPRRLSLKSQKNIMDLLRKYFNDLYNRGEIREVPKFPPLKISDPPWRWVDEDTQNMIYEQIPEGDKPIYAFLKEHGVRPGEARALWKEDVDFNRGTVTIRRNFSNEVFRLITKQKRQRIIPINPDVLDILKKLSVLYGFLFLDDKGKPYTKRKLERIFNRARDKAGIKDLTLYQWGRHSFASQAINRGVSQNIVGAFLGHSDARTTKRYAHTNIEGLKLVFNKNPEKTSKDGKGKIVKIDKKKSD